MIMFKGTLVGGHLGWRCSLVYLKNFLQEWVNIMSPGEIFLKIPLSTGGSLCCWVFVFWTFHESWRAGDMRAEPRRLAFSITGRWLVTGFRTRATGRNVNILLGKLRKPANRVSLGWQATSPTPGISRDKFLQRDLPYSRAMIIVHLKLQYSTL